MNKTAALIGMMLTILSGQSLAGEFRLITPNGFEGGPQLARQVFSNGESVEVKWYNTFAVHPVTIDLHRHPDHSKVQTLFEDTDGSRVHNTYSLSWTVNGVQPGRYLIRVTLLNNDPNPIFDESDDYFEIQSSPRSSLLSSPKDSVKMPLGTKKTVEKEKMSEQFAPVPLNTTVKDGPDLTVDFLYFKLENADYPDHYALFFWVINQGNEWSHKTTFSVTCEKVGGGPCPELFAGPYDVRELNPGSIASFMHEGPVPRPPAGVRYKLTGRVEPDLINGDVRQSNNQLDFFFLSPREIFKVGAKQELNEALLKEMQEKAGAMQLKPSLGVPVERKLQTPDDGKKLSDKMGAAPALLLSGKKSYSPRENVIFALQGEPKGEPVIECSQDGLRWGTSCPKGISVRKIGSGAQTRFMVTASEPGRYRLKLGDVISEPFEVKPATGPAAALPGAKSQLPSGATGSALTPAAKTPIASSGPVSGVKTPAAAAPAPKIVPTGAPTVRLNASNLTAPAKVKLNVQADPRFTAKYVLEKKENGAFREIAGSDRPEFDIAEPGDYRVKAQYLNGNFVTPLAFTVKSKMAAHPASAVAPAPAVTQPKTIQTPAKVKKMK